MQKPYEQKLFVCFVSLCENCYKVTRNLDFHAKNLAEIANCERARLDRRSGCATHLKVKFPV